MKMKNEISDFLKSVIVGIDVCIKKKIQAIDAGFFKIQNSRFVIRHVHSSEM